MYALLSGSVSTHTSRDLNPLLIQMVGEEFKMWPITKSLDDVKENIPLWDHSYYRHCFNHAKN